MPGVAFLRGERVTLRTVETEDADIEVIQRARNEPAFQDGLLLRHPTNRTAIEAFVENTAEDDERVELLVCIDEEPIGSVLLFDIRSDSATLAYWLLPEHHGEGYATEAVALLVDHAFHALGLHHLLAWTIDDNEASQALLSRLGFTHEGTYREHVFWNNEYHDTEHYGLLTNEWEGSETVLVDRS